MRQGKLFGKTSKTQPADDVSVNARLLEQGGFVQKTMAGVYSFLPLGWKVLAKIEAVVRAEMDMIGAQEMLMPALQPKANWETTGRWSDLDVLFKLKSGHGSEYALGPTHEEIITPVSLAVISSYKDLPTAVYQIQTKFRDEPRAKSGLLRGREFRMKDLYSFHASEEDLERYYWQVAVPAYEKIFRNFGLDALLTEASGGTFSKFSHEYQVELPSGEDAVYVCRGCGMAKNKEVYQAGISCTRCHSSDWRETAACEVGNIFKLQHKYSAGFNLKFTSTEGKSELVYMGCYGIGTSRLMGVIAEKFSDDRGLIWPDSVAPFAVHLLSLPGKNSNVAKAAERIYDHLLAQGTDVLYDDRDISPGAKFADADLLGMPCRVVISEKTMAEEKVEVKKRSLDKVEFVKIEDLPSLFGKD